MAEPLDEHIVRLIVKFVDDSLDASEQEELQNWVNSSAENKDEFERIVNEEKLTSIGRSYKVFAPRAPRAKVELHRRIIRKVNLYRVWRVAATVAVLVVGLAAYVYYGSLQHKKINGITSGEIVQHDVQPGGNKALLILGDNSKIVLDSAGNGSLGLQGGSQVIKKDSGILAYETSNLSTLPESKMLYNQVITPKGGTYEILLPDGSRVWLNSASSIRFPTTFVGPERRVEISGEAYFEVADNEKQPFVVQLQNPNKNFDAPLVKVLGTSFNVQDYADEPEIQTTLLTGKVKLETFDANGKNTTTNFLMPEEQAVVNNSGAVHLRRNVITSSVIAWKNGLFYFDHSDLHKVMRELSRWYDINVNIEGTIPDNLYFNGKVDKDIPLSVVLNNLFAGTLKYKIENKEVTITR